MTARNSKVVSGNEKKTPTVAKGIPLNVGFQIIIAQTPNSTISQRNDMSSAFRVIRSRKHWLMSLIVSLSLMCIFKTFLRWLSTSRSLNFFKEKLIFVILLSAAISATVHVGSWVLEKYKSVEKVKLAEGMLVFILNLFIICRFKNRIAIVDTMYALKNNIDPISSRWCFNLISIFSSY